MMPAVGGCIGVCAAFEHGQADNTVVNIVAVFAVVEQGNPVAVFRQINKLVRADLKPCGVPACIFVGGPLHRAELNFVGCFVGIHLNGECGF